MKTRVFVTRPIEQSTGVGTLLKQVNLPFTLAPALAIKLLNKKLPQPKPASLGVFVSRNAVKAYFSCNNWPVGAYACAVGKVTAQALAAYISPEYILAPSINSSSDSEALLKVIDKQNLTPGVVNIYRAESGRNWLAMQLEQRNWQPRFHTVYKREPIIWDNAVAAEFSVANPAILLLTSIDALAAINTSLKRYNLSWPQKLVLVTLHKRIADNLEQVYLNSSNDLTIIITRPDDVSMFKAIAKAVQDFT